MIPKVYVLERSALAAWGADNSFTLTFDAALRFIHDLQDAMVGQRKLSDRTGLEFFILVIPKLEKKT